MALTKIPIELSSTPSIVDGGNATAITIDSNEGVAFSKDISTSTAGTSNFRAGVNAGNSIESGGNYNTVVGDEAGTAITTGDNNVAVGYQALSTATAGSANVAVGGEALASNTAINNTAVGHKSAYTNTTGTQNSALGTYSLFANTEGDFNTAVGYTALATNTTADNNTAIGHKALNLNTTGHSNVGVGKSALEANTTGVNMTAVGYNAGLSHTTGNSSTFIGTDSGKLTTTGVGNTFVGDGSGRQNTSGSSNVAMGQSALLANTTAGGNVAVGYNALDDNTTGDLNTAIGTNALGSNVVGDRSVAVGYNALQAQAPTSNVDSYNVAVGLNAGFSVTTGRQNTLIGGDAGDSITTGVSNILLGYLTAASAVDVNAEFIIGAGVTGSGGSTITIGSGAGKISNAFTSNATWTQSSDSRLKTNIQSDSLGLSFINRLNPVTYNWKPSNELDESLPYYKEVNERDTSITMHGLIAQEVKTALDAESCATFAGWGEGLDGVQTISREMFVIPLIKAMQEQTAVIAALTARLETLEGE